MNIIQRIKSVFQKNTEAPLGSFQSLLTGQMNLKRTANATEIAYVVACIEKRAKLVSQTNFLVTDGENEIESPLNDLLDQPNQIFDYTFQDLLYLIQTRLDYLGNAFIWARPSNNGREIVDLIPILTNQVKVHASNTRWNAEYEFNLSGSIKRIKGEEIIHFRKLGIPKDQSFLNNHLMGTPVALNSIKNLIQAQKEMYEYIEGYFENDTIPPMIFESPDGLTEDQYLRLRENYNASFGASTKKPKLLLSENGGKFTPMDVSKNTFNPSIIKDGLDKTITEQICIAFETPRSLLTNETKYADRNEFLQTYKLDVIKPLSDYIASTFEMHFREYYDIRFEVEKLSYVNEELKLKYLDLLAKYNAISVNELREAAGYEETSQIINEIKKKSLDPIYDYWKKYDDVSEGYKETLEKQLIRILNKLEKEIQSNLKKQNEKGLKAEISENISLFDLNETIAAIISTMEPELFIFLEEILILALNDIDVNLNNPEKFITDTVKQVNELMKEPVETIDKEIKSNIKKIIEENPFDTAEDRFKKVSEMIGKRFTIYTDSRVKTISRTTATSSSESLKSKVFKDAGFDKVWISSRDGKVRDTHQKADQSKAENGLFNIGGHLCEYPSDPKLPAKESVNCRCRVAAKKKGKIYINGKGI